MIQAYLIVRGTGRTEIKVGHSDWEPRVEELLLNRLKICQGQLIFKTMGVKAMNAKFSPKD